MANLALYRFYDDGGQLLYVGITNNPTRRMSQHEAKAWWPNVRGMTLDWYPDRATVLAAEKRAIRVENPLHNVQNKPDTRPRPIPKAHTTEEYVTFEDAYGDERDIPTTTLGACRELLAFIPDVDRDEALREASEECGEAPEVAVNYVAVESILRRLIIQRMSLMDALEQVGQGYPEEEIKRCADEASKDRPGLTEVGFMVAVVDKLTEPDRARACLSRLADPERGQWLESARQSLTEDATEREVTIEAFRKYTKATTPPPPF